MLFGKPKGLPVLVLRDVVVFPFETKALVVTFVLSSASSPKQMQDKSMLLVMQDAVQVNPALSELHRVGILAKVLQVLRLPTTSIVFWFEENPACPLTTWSNKTC